MRFSESLQFAHDEQVSLAEGYGMEAAAQRVEMQLGGLGFQQESKITARCLAFFFRQPDKVCAVRPCGTWVGVRLWWRREWQGAWMWRCAAPATHLGSRNDDDDDLAQYRMADEQAVDRVEECFSGAGQPVGNKGNLFMLPCGGF